MVTYKSLANDLSRDTTIYLQSLTGNQAEGYRSG
nr:MAG TPA: hypothetical protein [Caudoviricetes sp.]